ncbi:unnamed protein product [Dicrocoelium dendriticum]|nr:unnamed protein product [Dicrocoelium dendriticum]
MIAEAEKSKKAKISDLIARLEQIAVPDTPVSAAHDDSGPVNSVICASESEAVTFTEQKAAAEQLDESTVHTSEEVNQTSDGLLYPNLVDTDAPDLPVAMIAETLSEDKPTETSPAQPSTLEKVDCVECVLPSALSHDYLRNLYISHSLESLSTKEEEFLQEVDGVRRGSASDNTEKDPFEVLLLHYAHVWNQWSHALDRFRMVNAEIEQMSHKLWDVRKKCNSVTGKCKDGVSVSLEYEYEEAELDHSAVTELAESEGVIRWVVFEELPSVAYSLSQLRNQINEHLLSALTSSPSYRKEAGSEPVNLLDSDPDPIHCARIRTLRSICSTLFSVIRRQARGPQGRSRDSIFRKQLHDWTLLTAGTLLRSCRPVDHLFLLMQLLRLPSYHLRGLLGILNPPDPSLAWNRCTNLVDFLHQPEVELLLSLFAVCLRPVRNRHSLLTSSNSELHDLLTASFDSPPRQASESRWTVVDSGGESDQEDSVLLSSRRQVDLPTPPESPSVDSESSIFVGPRDLEALLRQLNFERLIQLLVCDNTRPTHQYAVIGSGSGLLTLLAFADQLLDLIQSCGAIYSDHLGAPNPRTHLGCWRILAKRLAGLISLLVLAIGSRIRHAWIQQTISESCVDFRRVISQYDYFCLRAANCLLSGCGLPSTHHEAVRLVCWRSFVALFPFGLTSSRSKVDLLNCILASILPSWSTSSSVPLAYLPGQVVNPLHRALLSIGLNDVGLEAFLTALGNLAALECRPIVTASAGPGYQLPSMEADLIRAIVQILFAVSVFHTSCANEGDSQPTGALGLMPVAPECGRIQLTSITYAHAHISLPLLFDLIVSVCSRISREVPLKPSRRSFILTVPSPTGQPFRVQELLVALSTELPLHLLQPEASHVATLITWLVDRSPETFEHVLARTILQRLNWESVVDSNTGEPFIPFRLHLDLALALAQLVDNRLLYPSRFNAIVYHPVVNRVLSSTKSSASFAVGAFLTSLGYRQLQIQRPVTAATDRQPRGLSRRSDVLLSSYPFDSRRSKSNAPTSEVDGSVDASKLMLSWCVDLLLRLHLPGCAAPLAHQQPSHSLGNTNDLSRVWKLLSSMHLERNPVASFLLISLNMQLFGQSSAPSSETSVYRLVNTVIDCQQTNLVLRTLSLLFHQYATSTLPVTCPDFAQCLSRVFHLHKYGQLHPIAGSTFVPLIVGACLDACLAQPYSCSGLLVSLHDCLTQPGWSQSLDRVSLLEALLQITMWIHNSYIPSLLSSKPHVTNWHQSTLFQSFKIVLKHTYASQPSTSSLGWADRFVTLSSVASWAWFRSTGVLQGLKDRILSDLPSDDDSNPPNLPSNSFSLSDAEFSALFGTHRSMLFTLWLEICTLQSSPHDHVDYLQWSAHPFWILSAAFVADLEQQTFADGNPTDHTAVWARLSAVLITHLDELITVFHNPGAPISSGCPVGTSLALLLERLLLEADVLCPDSANPTGPAGQAQSVALVTRIRAELIQISVIQGVSLLDTCPTSHPAFILLLHTLLSHLFGIRRALSSQPECHTPCNLFPVGIALLRCLPWSLFHIPFLAPVEYTTVKVTNEPNGQVDSRSLLDVLLARLRKQLVFYGGITDNPAEQSKCIRRLSDLLDPFFALMLQETRYFGSQSIWTCLLDVMNNEVVECGGLSSSTESVSALLNSLGASLSNQPSSTLPTATTVRESLLEELLHSTGENVTLTVIAILGRLILELGAKLGACVRENHMTAQSASSMLMEQLLHILGPFMQKSASAAIEGLDSPDGLNHRYLSILEASLASSSDTLRRVSQVCPPHVDPAWSCLLHDSFIHWLMSATCPCGHQDTSRPSLPGFNPHIGALPTGPPSAPVGSTSSVPLFAALCAIKDSALAGTENDPKLFTFSWAAWRPSIATLNAMIQVLLKSRGLPRPFSGISTASAMIALLGPIEWPTAYHSVDVTRQFVSSHWGTTEQSTGLNFSEMQSSDLRVAFLESLSFLLVLLTLLARNGDTELRNNLQQIIEAVLSDLHFSHVNDRCYSLILSHLVEAQLPAYCVLMPPTCLEGRLFG